MESNKQQIDKDRLVFFLDGYAAGLVVINYPLPKNEIKRTYFLNPFLPIQHPLNIIYSNDSLENFHLYHSIKVKNLFTNYIMFVDMLINLSNHPSSKWSKEQLGSAKNAYSSIVDLVFPEISPFLDLAEIEQIAEDYLIKIKNALIQSKDDSNAVHIMGEFTFTFNLLEMLKKNNIPAVASTTSREVYEDKDGNKLSKFNFIRFRNYY
jgi:hypothetical protein